MGKHLVLAIFNDEAAADAAVEGLNRWADQEAFDMLVDTRQVRAMGVLVLDANGKLKSEKLGPRRTTVGAGIGLVLAALAPIGLAAGIIGGGLLGAHYHKGLGLSNEDRERLGHELQGGKAAVGVLTDKSAAAAISAKLAEQGGAPEIHELDDAALADVDAAAATDASTSPDRTVV